MADDESLRQRIGQHGLRVHTVERTRMRRAVRAQVLGEPVEPTLIGRYTVVRRLGAGGMGVVYLARDAQLDREVAVKLVLDRAGAGAREQQRLLEEARALARLAHPNVVAIHDVGVHEGRVFLAMERIRGDTLRVHCAEHCSTWQQRLAAYQQAGRGLAATHAAGLVHRDFKPDNALVGADGRVRVLDFGLARLDRVASESEATGTESPDSVPSPVVSDAVVGTFRYMAPEQIRSRTADARADQFGFCVSLWESLHGQHPFPAVVALRRSGDAWPELTTEAYRVARDGEIEPATSVPAWLRRVLERGMAFDPAARFPSMDALLVALGDDPIRRRQRRILAVFGIAVVPLVLGVQAWSAARDRDACVRDGQAIAEVWNDEARTATRAAILGPGKSYGPATWQRVEPGLDRYARAWAQMRTSTCLTALQGRRQADLAARSTECLAERRDDLAATIDELSHATGETIALAVATVANLPSMQPCDDVASLAERAPAPADPAVRAELADLRRDLAHSRALAAAQQPAAARELVAIVLARAEALDLPALRVTALLRAGEYAERDDTPAAVAHYERAFSLAVELGDDDVALDALARLSFANGNVLGRLEEAWVWSRVAEAFLARADPEAGLPTADHLNARSALWRRQDDIDAALADQRRAFEIRERVLGLDDLSTLEVLANIGISQVDLGRFADAVDTFAQVVDGRTRVLGAEHPLVARSMSMLASAYGVQGRSVESRDMLERALVLEERALGPDHPGLTRTLHNLSVVQGRLGDRQAALATSSRALAIIERMPQPDPLRVAQELITVSGARRDVFDVPGAIADAERARDLLEASVGPDHREVAMALEELAWAHEMAGENEVARTERRRVVAIREATLGPWHPDLGAGLQEAGRSELLVGDTDAALTDYQRALAIGMAATGPTHPNVLIALGGIAMAQRMRGELDLALVTTRSAQALALAADPIHGDVAVAHLAVSNVLADRGDFTGALAEAERAWAIVAGSPESESTGSDAFLLCLAEAELGLGRIDDARDHAQAALAQATARRFPPHAVAEAEIVLARLLDAEGRATEAAELGRRACAAPHPASAMAFRRCGAWGR